MEAVRRQRVGGIGGERQLRVEQRLAAALAGEKIPTFIGAPGRRARAAASAPNSAVASGSKITV